MSEGSSKKTSGKLELKSRTLRCRSLHEYLKSLSPSVLVKLYDHPMTCLAVFRELSEIAKNYIMRILFVEQPVPQAVIASWLSKTHVEEHKEATQALSELHIFKESSVTGGLPAWTLNPSFKKNCKAALFGGGKLWFMSTQLEADAKPRDIGFLDAYAIERWECILYYMVGTHQNEGISGDAVRILLHAGLMKCNEDGSPNITKEGFQFLLMDMTTQVWYFMLQYLDTSESRKLDLATCLMFLFQLRFSILGKDYSTDGLDDGMLTFLQHLREFGLVYQRKRKAGRFYPTRLALVMGSKESGASIENLKPTEAGYIVVETNYRLYAYTTSNLKIAIIGLFSNLLYRFPGLAVGVITRDSIRVALHAGITAEQIVHFLKTNAHPKMLVNAPSIVPPTVVDQIYLWEQERNRFTFTEGALYTQFISQSDFDVVANYAQDIGAIIWQNDKKRMLVVTKSNHEDVRKFWKKHLKGNGS